MSDPDRRYLTIDEAAEYARLSSRTLRRAMRAGLLRSGGTSHKHLFLREWIDEWLTHATRRVGDVPSEDIEEALRRHERCA